MIKTANIQSEHILLEHTVQRKGSSKGTKVPFIPDGYFFGETMDIVVSNDLKGTTSGRAPPGMQQLLSKNGNSELWKKQKIRTRPCSLSQCMHPACEDVDGKEYCACHSPLDPRPCRTDYHDYCTNCSNKGTHQLNNLNGLPILLCDYCYNTIQKARL